MPVSKTSVGVPVTITVSVKVTLIAIVSPILNVPSAVSEETEFIVGASVPLTVTERAVFDARALPEPSVTSPEEG